MRTLNALVFDDFLQDMAQYRTSAEWNGVLGLPDTLGLFVVFTEVAGTSPVVTVQIETSANEVDWENLSGTAEIYRQTITAGVKTVLKVSGITNAFGFTRVRIELGASDNKARVQVWMTGRDRNQ